MKRKGILFVLSGPSGAGKGTVLGRVINEVGGLALSVSVTTRAPRVGEIDGIHYHFKTDEEFMSMVANDEFLEYVAKFNETKWGKKLAADHAKAQLNDFQRFKYEQLKQKRDALVAQELGKH